MESYALHDTFAGHKLAANFSPSDGHHVIDIARKSDTSFDFIAQSLRHDEITDWLSNDLNTGNGVGRCRVFITTPITSTAPGRRVYPLSLNALDRIMDQFCIPPAFANFAASHATVALDFEVPESSSGDDNGARTDNAGILCTLGPLAFAMTYRAATKTSSAIFLGMCKHQATKLIANLKSTMQVLNCPMLLPVIWLNILGETRAHRVIGRKDALCRIEVDLGIHWGVQKPVRRLQNIDFDVATRRLTVFGSETAWNMHAIEAQLEMTSLIENIHDRMYAGTNAPDPSAKFALRTHHIKQVLSGLMHWTKDTQQRIQVQLQTIYSLVSQRDNEISYETAVASQRIAEATKEDSAIMKEIATQTKALAIRTWRDGVDMRAMAVITLMTLPGTFTATLFSTSFFNFQPSGEHSVISSWVWLYVVVTALFTALCLLAWFLSSRSMSRRAEKAMSLKIPSDGHDSNEEFASETAGAVQLTPVKSKTSLAPIVSERVLRRDEDVGETDSGPKDEKSDGLAPAREYWDADGIWGTQSYGATGKACAMCAEHIHH